ncbi:phage tail tape measure protein [Trinickia mobilis]|uniref:phage tail tape measure protein n=1 Tax=Trinickia mobilis TaxID=2816356 RepID=UPI001A8BF479|nr:hypothetical protein [Trinickia mobilis]
MDNVLKLRVMFDVIDNMTKPLKSLLAGNKGLASSLKETRRELAEMGKTQKRVAEFREMRGGLAATASQLNAARERVNSLAGSIRGFGPPSRQMIAEFEKMKQTTARLTAEHDKQAGRVRTLRDQLAGAGVNTRNLAQHERELRASIASTTSAMSDQMRKLEALGEREKRVAAARAKMQSAQGIAANMAIGGYAAKSTGAHILGSVGNTLNEAKAYEQQVSQFRALGVGESKLKDAITFADNIDVKGLSKLDKLKLLKETYTITRDMHHAEEMAPILAKMKVGIESVMARRGLGEGHGEIAEQMLMDLVKTTELRGSLKSPEAFKQAVDNATKAYVASGGTVKPEEFLNAINTGAIAAKQLGDNSFYFGLLHTMQEMGGFRAGTGLMSAYSNWAQGRTTQQASEDLVNIGLIDPKSVKYGTTGHVTKVMSDNLKQVELYKTDPFEYLMKVVVPKINPNGKLDDQQVVSRIGQLFSSRKGGDLFASLYLERANIMKHRESAPKAYSVDALYDEGMRVSYGKEMDVLARKATLEKEIGEKVLPLYNRGLEITARLIERVSVWMERNQDTARILAISMAALGGLLVTGGTLTLGLAAIIGPLALTRYGMTMLGIKGGVVRRVFGRLASLLRGGIARGFTGAFRSTLMLWRTLRGMSTFLRSAAVRSVMALARASTSLGRGLRIVSSLLRSGFIRGIAMAGRALGMLGRAFIVLGRLALANSVLSIVTLLALAAIYVWQNWDTLGPKFTALWERIKGAFGAVGDWIKTKWDETVKWVKSALEGIGDWFGNVGSRFTGIGGHLIDGLANGIRNGLGTVKDAIVKVADSTIGWFKDKLGIHSPSRVFGELGGFISQGAALGMECEQGRVVKAAISLATVAATSFGAPALASGAPLTQFAQAAAVPLVRPSVPIDRRPALEAAPTTASVAGAASQIVINIYPAAGADPTAIAQAVRTELDRRERAKQSRIGSRLSDSAS